MKVQQDLHENDFECYESSLYIRDADLNQNLLELLQRLLNQINDITNEFAARMLESQSAIQASLYLLPAKVKPLGKVGLQIPNFIYQNIHIYEGIVSVLFSHPCYLFKMLKSGVMSENMVLGWIFKLYKAPVEDTRIMNLLLALNLMVVEDEIKEAMPLSDLKMKREFCFPKLYNFLMDQQLNNISFMKEITELIIQKMTAQDDPENIVYRESFSTNLYIRKKEETYDDIIRHWFDLEYHVSHIEEEGGSERFALVVERCVNLIEEVEFYLKSLFSDPHFSVKKRISREIRYLNSQIIKECQYHAEQAMQKENRTLNSKMIQVNLAVRDAELFIIKIFFEKLPEYIIKYSTLGIIVDNSHKLILSPENLQSISNVFKAYFEHKEISSDPVYQTINNVTTRNSKRPQVVKAFIQGMAAHDNFDITIDNILRVTEEAVNLNERYNTNLTVKEVVEIQNALIKAEDDPKLLLKHQDDPLLEMVNCIRYLDIDMDKIPLTTLQQEVKLKINSK